jgi:geranylgeranyl reductase family protein
MKHYPVIVVGAGPAGSTCAYHLAQKGVDVLVLEKARLPRLKPCGGGFPEKTRSLYDFNLTPVIEATVRKVIICLQGERHIFIDRPEGVGYMVMRDKFDAMLAEKAASQGAKLHQEEECISVEPEKNRWIVKTGKDTFSADFLVGADGAPSGTAQKLGLMRDYDRFGVAISSELRVSDKQLETHGPTVLFDFMQVPKGYAWIFPKADHLSVGFFSALPRVKGMRKALDAFIEKNENLRGYKEMSFCKGHLMPRGGVYNRIVTEGALLLGDAAAMTDPFFGEGIYYAARSGIMASNAIIRAMNENHRSLEHYDNEIRKTMVKDFWWARFFNFAVYRFPTIAYYPFQHRPYLQDRVIDVISGNLTWQQCVLKMIFLSPHWALKRK